MKDKKPNLAQRALLETITTNQPFELITTDYLHLDQFKGKYLLVVVDHFTKLPQAFPTKNKSRRSTADTLFNKYFLDFRFPKRILYDQGKEFDNKLFKRLSEIIGIKPSKTTPHLPMGSRLCKRMNQKLLNMLKTLPENFKSDWKSYMKKLSFSCNNTKNKTAVLRRLPHFLLFGRQGQLTID